MFRRASRTATAAAAAAVVLSAAGCTADPDDRALGNRVVIGIAEPRHLIPTDTVDVSGRQVLAALFYPLVALDDKGTPVPAAAESVTPDRTGRVWTIRLKPGLTFSNGEAVTAGNYIDAWNYGAYGPNGQRGSAYFQRIEGYADLQARDTDGATGPQPARVPQATTLRGLRRISDTAFTVTLSAPFAGWAALLNSAAFYPLPKAAFSAPGVIADGFENAVIGNGPFRMTGRWDRGSEIRMEKVAGFRGTVPRIDGVTWKIYRDLRAEYADLVDGKVDVQPQIPLEMLDAAADDLGDRLRKSANSTFTFVGFPMYQREFAKPEVRRALSMAIDRRAMTDELFRGTETPATAFVSPVVPGYRSGSCAEHCTYDPERARAMYAAAGGPRAVTISYNRDGGHRAWVDEMCRQISASLGITCTGAEQAGVVDLLAGVQRREPVGLIRMSWAMDYPLMESYLSPLYGTNGSSNVYGYRNAAFDSLLEQGSKAATPALAVQKWQQAEDVLADDMPVIPLRFGQNVFGHSGRVTNVSMDAAQRVDLYRIETVG
jgi:ABC-type oligopeptide transport system substrate-binding subunit